jgi:hypothetical protein
MLATAPQASAASFGNAVIFDTSSGGFGSATSAEVDGAGNTYLASIFDASIDVDPGPGSTVLTSNGDFDAVVTKLDKDGHLVWARQIGDTGGDIATSLVLDGAGNVYVVGVFGSNMVVDGHPLVTAGGADAFVIKLAPDGTVAWAESVGGTGADGANTIAIADDGSFWIGGQFTTSADVDPGPGTVTLSNPSGGAGFVLKLKPTGELELARAFTQSVTGTIIKLVLDAPGNLYVLASFRDVVDADPGPDVVLLTGNGVLGNTFVAKLAPDGQLLWAFGLAATDDGVSGLPPLVSPAGLALGPANDLSVNIVFGGSVDVDPGPATRMLTSPNAFSSVILKLTTDGQLQWAHPLLAPGALNTVQLGGAAIDAAGNVYAVGFVNGTVDYDSGPDTVNIAGHGALVVLKLDPDDHLIWAHVLSSSNFISPNEIKLSQGGSVFVAIVISGSADLDPGPGIVSVTVPLPGDTAGLIKLVQTAPPNQTVPAAQTTAEGTPLIFSAATGNRVSLSDADAGASPIRVTLTATNGTLTLGNLAGLTFSQGDGTADPTTTFTGTQARINAALDGLRFTPTPGFSGTGSLQMTSFDQVGPTGGQTSASAVQITVTPINHAPVATADSYTVVAGNVLTVPAPGVLANDSDAEPSTTLRAELVGSTTHGSLVLGPDGGFTYTPGAGFAGADSFSYRPSDGTATGSATTVSITVTPTRCTPRPNVQTRLSAGGSQLQVHVEATPLATQQNNSLASLTFGELQNARVTLAGQPIVRGQTYTVADPANTHGLDFTVERVTPGQPTMVPFTVTDGCGDWPTFVGGGRDAGF